MVDIQGEEPEFEAVSEPPEGYQQCCRICSTGERDQNTLFCYSSRSDLTGTTDWDQLLLRDGLYDP
jgi:hypothetical protein